MTEVAGEVCDGFLCHGFTTERYLREVTLPALERGPRQGRHDAWTASRSPARRSWSPAPTRRRWPPPSPAPVSRSPSTAPPPPTAACSSCTAGASLQAELNALSKQGRWVEMGGLIDDEILNTFAVVGDPKTVGRGLVDRWGPVASRISLYATYSSDPAMWPEVIDAIRTA